LYDFASSAYAAVLVITIYSAYFIGVISTSTQSMSTGMPALAMTPVLLIITILTVFFAIESVYRKIAGNIITAAVGSSQSFSLGAGQKLFFHFNDYQITE